MPWQAPLPVPAALEQGVGSPSPPWVPTACSLLLLLLPGAQKTNVSLLVTELENLQKDGGWQRLLCQENSSHLGSRNAQTGHGSRAGCTDSLAVAAGACFAT